MDKKTYSMEDLLMELLIENGLEAMLAVFTAAYKRWDTTVRIPLVFDRTFREAFDNGSGHMRRVCGIC